MGLIKILDPVGGSLGERIDSALIVLSLTPPPSTITTLAIQILDVKLGEVVTHNELDPSTYSEKIPIFQRTLEEHADNP